MEIGYTSRFGEDEKSDDPKLKAAVFSLLHEPPSLSGYNRTTWRMDDLHETLKTRGFPVCDSVIRTVIKEEGFRWKSARVVLTSNDVASREKLDYVQTVLSQLGDDERFFFDRRVRPIRHQDEGGSCLG